MNLKTKVFGSVGAVLLTMSVTGAVAYAATSGGRGGDASTGDSAAVVTVTANSGQYASQIKAALQQIKSLEQQRRQLNQQLTADVKNLKGRHVKQTDPTDYQAMVTTHEQVLGVRTKLDTNQAAILTDRQDKDWAKLVTDLQTQITDLQNLIDLKQQQLQNVEHALSATGASGSGSSSSSTA
ncbi:hypothetical protein GCM10025857_12680 [Alicyclobacillus contaminans]|uniref:hypothetical protein n=1 Tax=Alicyclobacillus contaminans TaxID=392016 RepID=UPI0004066D80|nr:hypothetical protein [Alicyclobacillus contaminans]GMA49911.1 hypothetical protein GCM10025857_12680 [Alicyclobacillus contaminans]